MARKWIKIYCFGKNHKEFVISATFEQVTNESPSSKKAAWTCSKGIKVKRGNGVTNAQGDLLLYKGNDREKDPKSPAFLFSIFFRGDGVIKDKGEATLPASWVLLTNQGEHKWTIGDAQAKKWRDMYKVGLQEEAKHKKEEAKKKKH